MSDEDRPDAPPHASEPHPALADPLNYPVRPEIVRERARRLAALAADCGEIVPRSTLGRRDEGGGAEGEPVDEEERLVREDVDAAVAYFAAVDAADDTDAAVTDPLGEGHEASSDAAETFEDTTPGQTLDFSQYRARRVRRRLLELLDTLVVAIEQRDLQLVWDVLDEEEACRCFPPGIREEALVIARMPSTSFRAPIRLYRYYHLLRQLGDEPLGVIGDPRQLPLDLDAPASAESSSRPAIDLTERRSTPPESPRTGGGSSRRSSGSR